MFPLLIGLDSLVEVISPVDWLIEHLLDSKTLHFRFILQNVVKDTLSNGVEVVFVDFIEHGINQVLNALLLDSV